MRCQFCRKRIGLIRRLKDREYCSNDHRARGRVLQSARFVRDVVDLYGDEPWLGAASRQKPSISPGVGLLLVAACVFLLMFLPSGSRPSPPPNYLPPTGAFSDRLMRALPGKPSISLREDFRLGLRNWMSTIEGVSVDGWSSVSGWMKPGAMRLWKPTLQMADYQFEFEGQIEKKAMSWAFRATDQANYYGTKLSIVRNGGGQRAEIVRHVQLDGQERSRLRLPIPIDVREGVPYVVKMRVKGHRFHTVVNGQLVDSWTDRTLRAGGVGFYSDTGERSALRWVSISDRDGFLQRFLTLSFLIGPVDLTGPILTLD